MSDRNRRSLVLIAGLAGVAGQTLAATTADQCARIDDDPARLSCYDAIFRTTAGAPVAPAAAATATAVAVAVDPASARPVDPEAEFGLTPAQQRKLQPENAPPLPPETLTAKVAAVGRKPMGELVVTLENKQVWVQIDVDNKARVKAGDTVTIKRGTLGSYLLVSPNGVATRVRRSK